MTKISIYDPFNNVYREVSIDNAEKYVNEVEKVKKELNKIKNENKD